MKKNIVLFVVLTLSVSLSAQKIQRDSTVDVRIGYSSGNQNTLAGAVEKVTGERINKGLVTSSIDALNGQAAGVQVTTGVIRRPW